MFWLKKLTEILTPTTKYTTIQYIQEIYYEQD